MTLTTVHLYDWSGIYDENGKLLTQGHSIRWDEALESLGHTIKSVEMDEDDDLNEFGNQLPDTLQELRDYIERKKK